MIPAKFQSDRHWVTARQFDSLTTSRQQASDITPLKLKSHLAHPFPYCMSLVLGMGANEDGGAIGPLLLFQFSITCHSLLESFLLPSTGLPTRVLYYLQIGTKLPMVLLTQQRL